MALQFLEQQRLTLDVRSTSPNFSVVCASGVETTLLERPDAPSEVDTKRFHRVKEIFSAVCESSAENRFALLDSLCADDEIDLRSEVEALLNQADRPAVDIEVAASQLGGLIAAAARNGSSSDSKIALPESIGAYRILKLIGEGGMGVVYLAQQERPRRMVALKVIRPGFATPSLVRRFEHEAHILGRLQHPGIAQVYDAGLAPTKGGSQPFLVMEYFEGVALLTYAKDHNAPESQRVQLMIDVCNAVQHAHVRGVIHRDLKPANILVNTAGQIKVLDFGVARVIDADAQITIAPTAHGQLVGTLAYMSPEQLTGDHDAVDTRSDVYSLGVICYELLTGNLPYEMQGRPLPVLIDAMRSGQMTPHSSLLRGDLQTIILKAMSPERDRRYQSALELAEDLRRYLKGEPINARRDSVTYLVRKQVRRYRSVLLIVMLALCASTLFAVYALNQAKQQAAMAVRERDARQAAETSQAKALASEQHASRRRDESQAVSGFLMAMLKMADPDITEDYDASVRSLLSEASRQVAGSFAQFPEAEAEVRGYLGRIHATLGDLEEAESHLRRSIALYDSKPDTPPEIMYGLLWHFLHVELDLNDVLASSSRIRGERLGRSIIGSMDPKLEANCHFLRRQQRRQVTHLHIKTVADEFATRVKSQYTPDHPIWLLAADQLHLLGLSHRLSFHPAHAAEYFAGALDLYRVGLKETNPRVARTLGELTNALLECKRLDEAAVIAQHSLELLRGMLPQGHWYIHVYESRLARALLHTDQAPAAAQTLEDCFQKVAISRGDSSPLATTLLAELIRYYDSIGHHEKANVHRHRYALGLAKAVIPASYEQAMHAIEGDHPEVVEAIRFWDGSFAQDDPQIIAAARTRALQLVRDQVDPSSAYGALMADMLTSWGGQHARRDLPDEAKLQMLDEARRITEVCPHRHPRKAGGSYWWLANFYEQQSQGDAAVAMATKAVQILESSMPKHDSFVPVAKSLLAGGLMLQGKLDEAFSLALSAYREVTDRMGRADVNSLIGMGRTLRAATLTDQVAHVSPIVLDHLHGLIENPPSMDRCITAASHIIRHANLDGDLYQAALQLTVKAGELGSLSTWGRTVHAAALYRAGRHEEALQLLRTLDQGEAKSITVLAFLTMAHVQANQPDLASASFAELRTMRDSTEISWSNLAEMLYLEAQSRMPE